MTIRRMENSEYVEKELEITLSSGAEVGVEPER